MWSFLTQLQKTTQTQEEEGKRRTQTMPQILHLDSHALLYTKPPNSNFPESQQSAALKSQIQALPMEKGGRRDENVISGPECSLPNPDPAPPKAWKVSCPSCPRPGPSPGSPLCSHPLESGALTTPSVTSTMALIGIFLRFYMRSFSIILCSISAQPGEGMYNLFCYLIELVVLSLLCQYKP